MLNLKERIAATKNKKTKFILSAGLRFGGKTASLGTLPGKTLLAIVGNKESGAEGAIKVASENENVIDVVNVIDSKDVLEVAKQALEAGYDNVAVDGLSALSEAEAEKPKIKKMLSATGNAVFGGWRAIGNELIDLIQGLKDLSSDYNKPIVLTMALKDPKTDSTGNLAPLEIDAKGNMALSYIKGRCPFYVCAREASDKEGNSVYVLQTTPDELYAARLDGVLAKDLPKGFRCQKEKIEKGQLVGFSGLLNFLENY